MFDRGNTWFVMLLSLVILLGWHHFVAVPYFDAKQKKSERKVGSGLKVSADVVLESFPRSSVSVRDSLFLTPENEVDDIVSGRRIPVETDFLIGSVNLNGGKLDDLLLQKYRVDVDPGSPPVRLLSPHGGKEPYVVETGWLSEASDPIEVPGPNAIWSQIGDNKLTASKPVVLRWVNKQGFMFTRTISVDSKYLFKIVDQVRAPAGLSAQLLPYSVIRRVGLPETSGYYILHEGPIGNFSGLKEVAYSDLLDEGTIKPKPVNNSWIGFVDKYWGVVLIPDQTKIQQGVFAANRAQQLKDAFHTYIRGELLKVGDKKPAVSEIHVFAGPKEVDTVTEYKQEMNIDRFENLIDWGWFWFITQPVFLLISYMHGLLHNVGLAILAVTVILKLAFFPLANRSYEAMSKMRKLQPALKSIQAKFENDKWKQQQETMELYRRENISPLSGCLPVILQIPVFFSLYKVLFISIEMRHAPFFGWIQDLSAPDPLSVFNLFGALPYQVPEFLSIGPWPLFMGLTMFLQLKMNPAPTDKVQQVVFTIMPVAFVFMLASFPSGLVIYWAWSNTLSILQQGWIMRRNGLRIELIDKIMSLFK